jgi:enoyl-[acyl-carrier protein] reductase I
LEEEMPENASDTGGVEGLLAGKRGLIFGVANRRSIAWSIAQALSRSGARLAFTYQGERLRDKVEELAKELPEPAPLHSCDVTNDEEIAAACQAAGRDLGGLEIVVHSVAFAERKDLEGEFVETSRAGFLKALEVSAYSLAAVAREAVKVMPSGGSMITLTYLGGEKVVPGYNVMGVAKAALESSVKYLASDLGPKAIRVNAISAGPINTLAARGIAGFTKILDHYPTRSPMKRNVEPREVADTALFLASHLSSGITGEVIYVDCGYHVMGM